MKNKQPITVQTIVNTSLEKVWDAWVTPSHIEQWNTASNEWHTPKAINNLKGEHLKPGTKILIPVI